MQECGVVPLPNQVTKVGSNMDESTRDQITRVLKQKTDLFAWCPIDIPNIDPDLYNLFKYQIKFKF